MVSSNQVTVTVIPDEEPEELQPVVDLHPLEQRRNSIRERCVLLKQRSLQLGSAIEACVSGIRHQHKANGLGQELDKLVVEKSEVDTLLKRAEKSREAAEAALQRSQRTEVRQQFDAVTALLRKRRAQLVDVLRQASDLAGEIHGLLVTAPNLLNQTGTVEQRDRDLLNELNEVVNPYTGPWMDTRDFVAIPLDRCSRVKPTKRLGAING